MVKAIPILAFIVAISSGCADRTSGPADALPTIAAGASSWDSKILSIDHFVPHISTTPANAGQSVQLFVRERVRENARGNEDVVLFVLGGSIPGAAGFDLPFEQYSWLAWLAKAGFDAFAVELTGYGRSPRPMMDNPCNVDPADQPLLIPRNIPVSCSPTYPFRLGTSQADWDEIDRVVDYLRQLRHVDRVSLVGWSAAGSRVGRYVADHPEKVKYLFFYAPTFRPSSNTPPTPLPQSGVPMTLQTRADLYGTRWDPQVKCDDQVPTGVREAVWDELMANDDLGRSWGPPEGVMRVRTMSVWGWNAATAARITVPTLIIVGEHDAVLPEARNLYAAVGTSQKVFATVACGSHFMVWERQHRVLHHVSKDWLKDGNLDGFEEGVFYVDNEGVIHKQ